MSTVTKIRRKDELLSPGHTACGGCGQALAARHVVETAGKNTIITNATGCLEVFTSCYPRSAWNVPWLHSLFENAAAVAAGVEMALKAFHKKEGTNVIAQAGDGGTADIGLQALSGMLERGHDVLYVCYDNEAYMNTGIQRSSLTPYDSSTTTSPAGKLSFGNPTIKKNMVGIAVAHGAVYVASASAGYPRDIKQKVRRALKLKGPKYLQVHCPCPLGWRYDPALTQEIGQAGVNSGLYPLLEYVEGKLVSVMKIKKVRPVEDFLKPQARFRHLFTGTPEANAELAKIQAYADANIERFGLTQKAEPDA